MENLHRGKHLGYDFFVCFQVWTEWFLGGKEYSFACDFTKCFPTGCLVESPALSAGLFANGKGQLPSGILAGTCKSAPLAVRVALVTQSPDISSLVTLFCGNLWVSSHS